MRHSFVTGAAAVNYSLSPGIGFQLREVRIHLDAVGGAGNLTISVDSAAGATYDAVLATQDMSAVADLCYMPDHPHEFVAGDVLKIAWANAGTKTYGIEVIWAWSP